MYETTVAIHTHPAALSPVGPASPSSITGNGSQAKAETATPQHAAQDQPQLKGARFQTLAALNNQFNQISQSIGKVSRAMDQIEARIEKISDKLTAFRKIFPPYPPGSEERVKLLNTISGLRKQIQQLTYPPEDAVARAIIAPTAGQENSEGADGITFKAPGMDIAVRSQSMKLGPGGLDLPQLSSDVTDEEIDEILEKIIGARKSLETKRMGLFEDAEKLFAAKTRLGIAPGLAGHEDVRLPAPLNVEFEAEGVSQRIIGVLTSQQQGIAEDPMVFKSFIG